MGAAGWTGGEIGGSDGLTAMGDKGWSSEVSGTLEKEGARLVVDVRALGTMVGDSRSGLSARSSFISLDSFLGMDQGLLGGEVGLRDIEVGGEAGPLDEAAAMAAAAMACWLLCWVCCMLCCIRQWILNQFDLRPYLEPDLDIPTIKHFLSRQALQAVLFFLSTMHW